MKVSVLLPVYEVERYIAQCAETLMQQTYDNVEYIFVDDCTPDSSIELLHEVIAKYPKRESQVHILRHEQNKGLAGARQTALDAATGDAVLFVDSDDYIDSCTVESLVKEMERSQADIVDGGFDVVSKGETTKRCMPLHTTDRGYLRILLCQNVEPNRIWCRLIKKSLFDNNGIHFHQGINYSEDFTVLPLLLINGRRSWVDKSLYYYRDDNPQSYTNNITTKNAISFFKAQDLIGAFMASHDRWKEFSFSAQIGWVNVWRFARRFKLSKQLVTEHFTKKPSHIVARFLEWMFRCNKVPYRLANFFYLAVRRIYLTVAGR